MEEGTDWRTIQRSDSTWTELTLDDIYNPRDKVLLSLNRSGCTYIVINSPECNMSLSCTITPAQMKLLAHWINKEIADATTT